MRLTRRELLLSSTGATLLQGGGQAQPAADSVPTVFWVADPVDPGDTIMFFGDSLEKLEVMANRISDEAPHFPTFSADLPYEKATQALQVLQRSERCIKALMPEKWTKGLYLFQLTGNAGTVHPPLVNRPEIWWVLGENGSSSPPGGEVWVFGKNFRLDETGRWEGRLVLHGKGRFYPLTVASVNPYAIKARLPENLSLGEYELFVHNGFGGKYGWSSAMAFGLQRVPEWPQTVHNVRSFGAKGDGSNDDTSAFQRAFDLCAQNGGGIMFIPRGVYRITAQLNIPSKTVLRGEKRELVWLYVPKEIAEFNTVFAGKGEFGIEELSIAAQTPRRIITAPDVNTMYAMFPGAPWGYVTSPLPPKANDIFLRRLRIQHLRYAHRVGSADQDPRRLEIAGPSTIALFGDRIEISDCEVVSSGMPIILHQTRHSRVLRNYLHTGRAGWYGMWGPTETIFEGNTVEGRDLEATYGSFSNYEDTNPLDTDVSRLYIANNRLLNGFGCEREAISFDSTGRQPWIGSPQEADRNSFTVPDGNWKENDFVGLACLVVWGKGLGQHRRIKANTSNKITLDKAWEIVPDSSSIIAILPYHRDVVIYHNYTQDTSCGVELWGGGYNFIIDGNVAVRSGGMWGTAAQYTINGQHRLDLCYFTQWKNNEIRESFIYQQGPEPDNSATLGLYTRDVATGALAGLGIWGNVFRNNRVMDNTRIGFLWYGPSYLQMATAAYSGKNPPRPAGLDNVIEGNSIAHARVGIEVQLGYEGTVVRKNRFRAVETDIRDWRKTAKRTA